MARHFGLLTIEIVQLMIIAKTTFYLSTAELVTSFGCPQFPLGDNLIMRAIIIQSQDAGKEGCREQQ